MAKSSRATRVKKNHQNLKKKVFGPVENARNERLSAKLLELAAQPKAPRAEMDVEDDVAASTKAADAEAKEDHRATEDVDMDTERSSKKPTTRSNNSLKRQKEAKSARIDKKRHRRTKNEIVFPKHAKKSKDGKKKR